MDVPVKVDIKILSRNRGDYCHPQCPYRVKCTIGCLSFECALEGPSDDQRENLGWSFIGKSNRRADRRCGACKIAERRMGY